jgi:ATP-dependent DNA helicase PIF1
LVNGLGLEIPSNIVVTRLYSHNADVEQINDDHLRAIDDLAETFVMEKSGTAAKVEQLVKSVLAPEVLELKVGAEVMFVANNFAEGFVNGSRGKVMGFRDGAPIVQLHQSQRMVAVQPHSWVLEEDGKQRAKVSQLPLRLAWAITIHKSQGMSLDSAEIDLSRAFTPGMGYVALSRVRSFDGVYLRGVNNTALAMHPEIFNFDEVLKQASQSLAQAIPDDDLEEAVSVVESAVPSQEDEALLSVLRTWRDSEAKKRRIPLYMVASNAVLSALATEKPTTTSKLLTISGIGPKMIEKYADELLVMIREHMGDDLPKSAQGKEALAHDFLASKGAVLSEEDVRQLLILLDSVTD